MAFTNSAIAHCKLIAATAVLLGALTSASYAYTQDQEQLCTNDAIRLCSAEIPDVDRVTACMIRQREQLSEGCKTVFHAPAPAPVNYQSTASRPSKPMSLVPPKPKRPSI